MRPSALNAALLTSSVSPVRTATVRSVVTSQTRAVSSWLAVSSSLPSGENAMLAMSSRWPISSPSRTASRVLYTRTTLPRPTAMRVPRGEIATEAGWFPPLAVERSRAQARSIRLATRA